MSASAFRPGLFLLGLLSFLPAQVRADSSVTNCTQQALVAALAAGGTASYTQDCAITLTNTVVIANDVTLDAAGHTVSISSSGQFRLFTVQPGVTFTVLGVTFSGGKSTNGGAFFIDTTAQVVLTNCIFSANSAIGSNGLAGADGVDPNVGQNGDAGTSGAQALGGAVYNLGALKVLSCQFLTNQASGGSGGAGGERGAGGGKTRKGTGRSQGVTNENRRHL